MASTTLDGNLVLAGLAVQHGMVNRRALERALATWSERKDRPLGRVLVEQGALREDDLKKLEALVRQQMEANGGDVSRTLMSLDCYGTLREVARTVPDPELHETLCRTAPPARLSGDSIPTLPPARPPSDPSTPAAPGELRYRVLRSHARGGLGEVFVAQDLELNREVAFKQIQARYAEDEPSRARFLLEGEVTGCLEHPGIVPVYGLGYDANGQPYYAMRFIRGQSLKEAITAYHQPGKSADEGQRALEFRKLLEQFVAVCNSIAYAHSRGVLHRDIKPDNVMLGQYGETLVVDWGIAKVLGSDEVITPTRKEQPLRPMSGVAVTETLPGEVIGTPAYMSPEQAAGELEALGPESDVYSLGATLYQLVSGQTAFRDSNVMVVLGKVQRGVFPPPRQVNRRVPRGLNAICLKAMALRPQDRYRTAKELAEDVERWLADEPVRAYREPLVARLTRWVRRHKALVTGAAALLVTAVVALAISTVLIGDALVNEEQARIKEEAARKEEKIARVAAEKAKRDAEEAQQTAENALAKEEVARRLEEKARKREVEARKERALAQVEALLTANARAVPSLIEALKSTSTDVLPRLRELWAQADDPARRARRTRVGLALLALDNADVKKPLFSWMIEAADPQEMLLLRDALLPHRAALAAELWQRADALKATPEERFRAMVALAAFDPANTRWKKSGRQVAERLLAANPLHLGTWLEALRPVRAALVIPVAETFRRQGAGQRRLAAAEVLAEYATDPSDLTGLALDADPGQWAILLPRLQANRTASMALLEKELRKTPPPADQVTARDELARRQAQAAVGLYQLGQPDATWPLLKHESDPSRRTYLTHALGRLNAAPGPVLRRLEKGQTLEASERRALILCLGEYTADQLPAEERQKLTATLLRWYRDDPDAGVHSALDWLLRHGKRGLEARRLDWEQGPALRKLDADLAGQLPGKKEWYVTRREGHTLALVRDPPVFGMGSPEYEPQRDEWEKPHRKRIDRSFAVGTREVTVAQFRRFLEANPSYKDDKRPGNSYNPDDNAPALWVTWYEAAAYCNWLSKQEGIPEDQWCYRINPKTLAVEVLKDCLTRKGYRLPTEAEWEYACRAGATTSRFYGTAETLLGEYGWDVQTSGNRTWPVGQLKPNDLGLFDVYGNAWEWCLERSRRYEVAGDKVVLDRPDLTPPKDGRRVIRGGSFVNPAPNLRSAGRSNGPETTRLQGQGFRVARTYP